MQRGRPSRLTRYTALVFGWPFELLWHLRHRGPSGSPSAFVEIEKLLRNGVTLERADIYQDGVRITWSRPRSMPLKEMWEKQAAWSPEEHRAADREAARRQREDGLIFDAPVLRLRRQRGRRFVGGELSGGGDDHRFSGDTWFRIRRSRLGDRFALKCVDERVDVEIGTSG